MSVGSLEKCVIIDYPYAIDRQGIKYHAGQPRPHTTYHRVNADGSTTRFTYNCVHLGQGVVFGCYGRGVTYAIREIVSLRSDYSELSSAAGHPLPQTAADMLVIADAWEDAGAPEKAERCRELSQWAAQLYAIRNTSWSYHGEEEE